MGADTKNCSRKSLSFLPCPSLTIQPAHLLSQNVIKIYRPPFPVYQNVIEKIHRLAVRTQALGVRVSLTGQPEGANVSSPKNDKDQVIQTVTVN